LDRGHAHGISIILHSYLIENHWANSFQLPSEPGIGWWLDWEAKARSANKTHILHQQNSLEMPRALHLCAGKEGNSDEYKQRVN
jgi:hypothetical protein